MSAANKSPGHHPFMDKEVLLNLTNGVAETLKTMADMSTHFEKPFISTSWAPPNEISVFLNVESDPFRGMIYFHFLKSVAELAIEKLTGSKPTPDSPEILDGVGEISNIFYGLAKTKLNQLGFQLKLSQPHPYWTKELPPRIGNTVSLVIPFKIENQACYIEIALPA